MLILNERAESLGLDGAPRLSAFLMSRDLLRAERAHRALSNSAAATLSSMSQLAQWRRSF